MIDVLADLEARGLVHTSTDRAALAERLAAGPLTAYLGLDPTADSLHIGNLIGLLVLRRLGEAGHRVIGLAGGATGLVGDPSGRSDERNLLDDATLAANAASVSAQIERVVDPDGALGAVFVDNRSWTAELTLIDFMRDVGRHVPVNQMLARDSVRSRLESDQGLSFTEFSYMLLQARDYLWLHDHHGCELQVGGSDQWGNIVSGVDLVRRVRAASVHALCWPLLTGPDGSKLGKSTGGRVWLSAERTSPYELYQHWMGVDDDDLRRLLLWFTLLPIEEVDALVAEHHSDPGRRLAHRALADAVTALVHGAEAARDARALSEWFFPAPGVERPLLSEGALALFAREAPSSVLVELTGERPTLGDVFLDCRLVASRSELNRLLGTGLRLNGQTVDEDRALRSSDLVDGRYAVLQRGKRAYGLILWSDQASGHP